MSFRIWPWRRKSPGTNPSLPDNANIAPYATIQRAPTPRGNAHGPPGSGPTTAPSGHGIGPSPSVEPPRVADFNFTTSPSPPQPQVVNRTDDQLQSAPEAYAGSSQLQSREWSEYMSVMSASNDRPSPDRYRLIPRISVMNPEGFKMPLLANSGPRPPEESVIHAEVTRHGGMYVPIADDSAAAEASYQVDVTPPVKKQELPAAIIIDPKLVSEPSASAGASPEVHEPMQPSTDGVYEIGDTTMKPLDSTLVPPVANLPMNSPKFLTEQGFEETVRTNRQLVYSDDQFFHEMKRLYRAEMCGFFRRYFSLKTLRAFRVLCYTPTTRPTVVPFDDFVLQEMMYAYKNPEKILTTHDQDTWVRWVFRLRRNDRRHALEFVEGWNTTRIAIADSLPWLSSCLVGVIWAAIGGDAQTAFTVASFILTSSSIILALLAIISSIESSGGLNR